MPGVAAAGLSQQLSRPAGLMVTGSGLLVFGQHAEQDSGQPGFPLLLSPGLVLAVISTHRCVLL